MDIIDIILARALTPQGQIETYAAKAQKAAQDASAAASSAQTAVNNIDSITQQTNENNAAAQEALENVNEALAALEEGGIGLDDVDSEIANLLFTINHITSPTEYSTDIDILYPDDSTDTLTNVITMYKQAGNSDTATMTQRAITDYINSVKTELQTAINNIEVSGGGTTNLGPENSGMVVIVGPDGQITSGTTTEASIIDALIKSGSYQYTDAAGIEVDYQNKYTNSASSTDSISSFPMYGGRMRCNVDDAGQITAWYGDNNFAEDGSNGQVMVYQPKFYYKRVPVTTTNNVVGKIIRKETILISPTAQAGFKIHPLFINENGQEVDYVFLSAYEGCAFDVSNNTYILDDTGILDFNNDKLSSIANAKPIGGKNNNLTIINAEKLAQNRGAGWHITNMAYESANQFLLACEYGHFNGQTAIESGISELSSSSTVNTASITGSTSSLGNATGAATSTINEQNGTSTTYTEAGKRAISYRGVENPWGNIWRMVGGTIIYGNGAYNGGMPYICSDFNYTNSILEGNYNPTGMCLSNLEGWISAFGYGNSDYDWVFVPAESANGNSSLPIGDGLFVTTNLNTQHMLLAGGKANFKANNGLFYYAADYNIDATGANYSARLMFIPQKNSIYTSNLTKWTAKMGG